jgi:phage terminase large subunit
MAMMTMAMPRRTTRQTPTERYIHAARVAGCPRDQIANFRRAGVVLQPRQLLASAAARECDKAGGPVRVGFGGARGGGKSHWALAQAGADDCQRVPGLKFLFLRKVLKGARESFGDLRRATLASVPHEYKEQQSTLRFANGSSIVLGHYRNEAEIDNYLGLQYDGAIIEEATTLTSRKRKDIATCVRTSKDNWRPRMYETTNPGGVGHGDFKREYIDPWRKCEESRTRFIPSTVEDNRFVNVDYKTELEQLTGWQLRAWRYGDWDIAAGQYFSNLRHDVHIVKPFAIPANWTVWGGLDYGFTHYTAAYIAAKDNDGNIYFIAEHAERQWVVKRHAEAIKSMAARAVGKWDRVEMFVAGADVFGKRGAERTVADQYEEEGIPLTVANNDRISGATTLLSDLGDVDRGIKPKLYIFDTCARLANCLPELQHDPNRPEDVLKVDTDDDGAGGDDFYDAARYTRMAAERFTSTAGFSMNYMR